jgi:hypothetical protein
MNIKTTTVHSIELSRDDLKKRLYRAFLDMFQDELNGNGIEYAEMDFNRMTDCMEQINKGNFKGVFADGHTIMILPPDVFNFVEKWFDKPSANINEKLELVIVDKNGNKEIVGSEYLCY